MARRSVVLLLCILTTVLAAAQAPEPVDNAAIAKIRDEGLNRSQVMETMFWLTDRYGPRLTGSKEFEEAGDWAVKQLQDWGVANVRKERFQFGRGWSLVKFHATMTEPRVMPIIGLPKSWTPGTSGLHSADVPVARLGPAYDVVVDDEHPALTERAHGDLRVLRGTQLAHHDHVERRPQLPCDLRRDSHSAPGQADDDGPAPPEVGQPQRELTPGVDAIAEDHDRTPRARTPSWPF